MNFQDLMKKMAVLDQPVSETTAEVDECGGMMPSMTPMPSSQQDSVNMNVSLNASGSGGIKDLMSILRGIEEKDSGMQDPEVIVKKMGVGLEDDFANTPDEVYKDIDAVTQTGADLHSKGKEAPKVNGGGNPMALESLKQKLQTHYNQVKGI
jgi:hypothetical protein